MERQDRKPAPGLEPRLQAHIGNELRRLYEQMLSAPVPDRFKDLLDELGRREAEAETELEAKT